MIRGLIWGDGHTGAKAGITPPRRWNDDFRKTQELLWTETRRMIRTLGPLDFDIYVGDGVDGDGKRDSIGLLETDTKVQAELAAEVLSIPKIPRGCRYYEYGTPYHTVGSYSYEEPIAEKIGADIADGHLLRIGGVRINARHPVGRSDIPYGQGTPTYKEAVRDQLEAILSGTESADLILRGHAHYSTRMDIGYKTAIIVPCLEWPETVFGRKCKAIYYHMGIGELIIRRPDDWEYRPHLLPFKIVRRREWRDVKLSSK
ncbi:MAG: hypothetical protein WC455_13955 [Dehalococcoidia bacterium]